MFGSKEVGTLFSEKITLYTSNGHILGSICAISVVPSPCELREDHYTTNNRRDQKRVFYIGFATKTNIQGGKRSLVIVCEAWITLEMCLVMVLYGYV